MGVGGGKDIGLGHEIRTEPESRHQIAEVVAKASVRLRRRMFGDCGAGRTGEDLR
jgi:hypothetical protein